MTTRVARAFSAMTRSREISTSRNPNSGGGAPERSRDRFRGVLDGLDRAGRGELLVDRDLLRDLRDVVVRNVGCRASRRSPLARIAIERGAAGAFAVGDRVG